MEPTQSTPQTVTPAFTAAAAAPVWLGAYRLLLEGAGVPDILRQVCLDLSRLLGVRQVWLGRKAASGLIDTVAASHEADLWLAMHQLQERWDGTVAGGGPSAQAVAANRGVWTAANDEGLLPWRQATLKDQIGAMGTWPVQAGTETWLLQIFATDSAWFESPSRASQLDSLSVELARLLADQAKLQQQALLAAAMSDAANAAFITDLNANIVWSNRAFSRLTGYSAAEVQGRNPSLLHSGRQGLRYYRELWSTIRSGRPWTGETVDRDRYGLEYTIHQTISPIRCGERITHYLSVHDDISRFKAEQLANELQSGADPITGLLYRSVFDQGLREACEKGAPFTLSLFSLRPYLDALHARGTEYGPALLAAIGKRILGLIQAPDLAARAQDGEFLILLNMPMVSARSKLNQLRQILSRPYSEADAGVIPEWRQALIGFPESGTDPVELLRHLDRMLANEPAVVARRVVPTH